MKGENIWLRILELTDIVRTQKWINDPELGEIMGYLPKSLLQQEEWFRSIINDDKRYIFAICLNKDNEHIGNVALGNIDYIHRNAMLSIFIFDKELHKYGYGKEAVKLILEFAFLRLNLNKVYLKTSPEYNSVVEFYEKLGFTKEGVLRCHEFKYGAYRDKWMYGLLRNEYLELYEKEINV